jgi:hypothetical protein
LSCAIDLVGVAGLNLVGTAYFQSHLDLIKHLTTKLGIGPVRIEELRGDGLCKTSLLRTARFASHQVRNMVAVGITGPASVRLWMRTRQYSRYSLSRTRRSASGSLDEVPLSHHPHRRRYKCGGRIL